MSCPYKDTFGEPRTGVHAMRIPVLDVAFWDTAMTVAGAWLLKRFVFKHTEFWKILVLLFLLGEVAHVAACVQTPVTSLFVNNFKSKY
jgi:hypothetical protein